MIVVSDTSIVTSLLQVGGISLLQRLYGEVLMPEAVQRELLRVHATLPDFLKVGRAANRQKVEDLEAELDLGEAEAIVLAKEIEADLLLIDEKLGRLVARREGLRIAGLIGLLVEAKRQGLIDSVRDMVRRLEAEAGFRIAATVKAEAFRSSGE